jgi:hypothetical protein
MIREKITHKDFYKIAKEHEFFLWHFLQKDQDKTNLTLSSIIEGERNKNELSVILDGLDIPYFESYTEDSVDFLADLGFEYEKIFNTKKYNKSALMKYRFSPVLVGFKKNTKVLSTLENCYCDEGVIQVINSLDPNYLGQIIKNLEKTPD